MPVNDLNGLVMDLEEGVSSVKIKEADEKDEKDS